MEKLEKNNVKNAAEILQKMITMLMMDIVSSATQIKKKYYTQRKTIIMCQKIAHIRLNKIATIIE